MASITRDSSPPEAPLASGRGSEPVLAASISSTSSAPEAVNRPVGPDLDGEPGVRHRQQRQLGGDLLAEPAGGLGARGRQRGAPPPPRSRRSTSCSARSSSIRSSVWSRSSSRVAERSAQASTSSIGLAVLAGQRGQRRPALGDRRQPGRVGVDPGGVRRDVGGQVGEQVGDLGQPVGQLPGLGVVLAHAVEQACGPPRWSPARPGRPARWRAPRGPARRRCAGCRRSPAATPRRRARRPPPAPARPPRSRRARSAAGRPPGPARARWPRPRRARARWPRGGGGRSAYVASSAGQLRTAEPVQRLALRPRLEQPVLVGLAVHRHQRLGDLGQRRTPAPTRRRRRPASAPRPTRCGPAPPGRPRPRRRPPRRRSANVGQVADPDHALDPGGPGAGAHRAAVGAAAEQQSERGHDHGLAGAGLTGDHGQPGAELERRGVDHAELADPDLLKHPVLLRAALGHPAPALGRAAPALDRQPELGHQPVGERRLVQPDQPHRRRAAAHLDPGAGRQVERASPVGPQHAGAVGAGQHLDGQHRGRRHDQRPREQRVRADRHHQQRLDPRPHDRAAGAEVVGGRAGRRRAHDAVAAPARERAAVDLDDDLEHPLAGGLLDARLVQRPGAGDDLAVAVHGHVEREPVLDGVAPRHDRVDGRLEVLVLRLGQEPDVPEVHPQHRRTGAAGQLRGAQDGAVAADHDDQLAVRAGVRVDRRPRSSPRPARARARPPRRASSRTTSPCAVSAFAKARATSRASSRPVWATSSTRRVGCGRSSRLHPLTRRPRRGGGAHRGVDGVLVEGRRAAAQPQEELDVPRRPGQRAGRHHARAPAAPRRPRRPRLATVSARSAGSRTTPPLPSRSLPTSNCGLTISARSPSGAVTPSSASSTSSSEMKDRSPTTTSTGPSVISVVSSRTFTRSRTSTRSSDWSFQASWP